MKKLLAIEYLKLSKLRSIRIILLIYLVALPAGIYGFHYAIDTYLLNGPIGMFLPDDYSVLKFPDIWAVATYTSSYFNVLMGILIIISIANEYTYKTMRQQVINGLSLKEVIASKFIDVLLFSSILTLYTFLVGAVYGVIYSGEMDPDFLAGIYKIGLYFIQTLCYFSLAMLIAVLLKRTGVSIIIYILSFLVETLIGVIISFDGFQKVFAFFPLNAFSKLIPFPIMKEMLQAAEENSGKEHFILSTPANLFICAGYMLLFFGIAYFILKKRDL